MALPPGAYLHLAAHSAHASREKEMHRKEKLRQEEKAHDRRGFFDAALHGSADSLLRFYSSVHVDVNASDTKYISNPTALYHAAQEGHSHIVERLLVLGAKINWGMDDLRTPLWIAARNGHQKALEILINRGGSLDGCNDEGLTPLAAAACYNHPDCLSLLMKSRAKVSLHDKAGNTALHHAIIKGRENIVRLLLVEGTASVTKGDKQGNEPLHLAVIHRQTQIIKLLIQLGKAPVYSLNLKSKSPIDLAIEKGDLDALNVMLDANPDLKLKSKKRLESALQKASVKGDPRIVERLLRAGAQDIFAAFLEAVRYTYVDVARIFLKLDPEIINHLDRQGNRALGLAAKSNYIKMTRFLLANNANSSLGLIIDGFELSPLYIASLHGYRAIVEILLMEKADANQPFFHSRIGRPLRTPLHVAEDPSCIRLLVSYGGDVNRLDHEGETPLHKAARKNSVEAIKTLCECGAIPDLSNWPTEKKAPREAPLECAVQNLQLGAIRTLVECGADINARNKENKPLLLFVIDRLCFEKDETVRQKWFQVAELLIQLGASPDDVDTLTQPFIVRAAVGCPIDVIEFLLKKGADINKPTSDGFTALHMVSDVDLLDFLITNKAQVQSQNSKGLSPLHMTARFGNLACFKKLVERGADLHALDGEGLSPFYHACLEGQLQIVDFLRHHETLKEQIKLYQAKGKKEISYGTINDKVKNSALQILSEHLEAYEKMSQSRWLVKPHSTRAALIKDLKTNLEATKKDSKLRLTDVLALVKGAQNSIKEKRAHGLKGYEKSKLYIELEKATRRIQQACDVISSIIEHNMH